MYDLLEAITNDTTISSVIFNWFDPDDNMVRSITNSTVAEGSNKVTEDMYNPTMPGTWTIEALFSDGTIMREEVDVSLFVLNESILGTIALIGSAISIAIAYNLRRS